MIKYKIILLIALMFVGLVGISLIPDAHSQIEDATNFTGVHIKSSTLGTATPQFMIWNQGSSNAIEVRSTAGTVVYSVDKSGNSTQSGTESQSGLQTFTGGISVAPNAVVAGPTAIATATPVVYINNAGAHNALVVAKNSTPIFTIGNTGAVTGLVLQNASGQKVTCGASTITAAATVVHGLSTPVAVYCTIAADPAGDQFCTYTNSAAVVTIKLWQSVLSTPAANGAATSTGWCVVGTP